jgi:biopolymer transport protein ExbD/biopolymer transport protein TolR
MAGYKTSGGRYKPQAGSQMAAPNVIPMADIMLVLLIIFMVVTPMLQKTLPVDMARVNNAREMQDADKDDAIIVAVTRDGTIYLKNTKITKDDITGQIKDLIANRLDKTVYVKSDQRAKYGDVVAVVDEIRSAGVDQLGLLTEQNQERRTTPAPPNPNAAAPTADLGTAKAHRSGRS